MASNLYRKNPQATSQSIADIDNLVSIYLAAEPEMESRLPELRNQAKILKKEIQKIRNRIEELSEEKGYPDYLVVKSDILGDSIVPDSTPESYLNFRDLAKSRKRNFIDETVSEVESVLGREAKNSIGELRELSDALRKANSLKSQIEYTIKKIENVQSEIISRQKKNISRYKQLMDQRYELRKLIRMNYEIIDLFDGYPEDFTSEDAIKIQDTTIDTFCTLYKKRIKTFLKAVNTFSEDHPEYSESMEEIRKALTTKKLFKDQYISAIDNKEAIILFLDGTVNILSSIRDNIGSNLDALAGKTGIKNTSLKNLVDRAKQILKSPVKAPNTDDLSQAQLQEQNGILLNKTIQKVNNIRDTLFRNIDQFNIFQGKIAEGINDKVAETLSIIGFPQKREKTPQETLEDRWREEIRNEYGGDIGFEDEVKAENSDGDLVWMKRSEAVEVKEGVWKSKTLVNSEEYRKNHPEKKEDVY